MHYSQLQILNLSLIQLLGVSRKMEWKLQTPHRKAWVPNPQPSSCEAMLTTALPFIPFIMIFLLKKECLKKKLLTFQQQRWQSSQWAENWTRFNSSSLICKENHCMVILRLGLFTTIFTMLKIINNVFVIVYIRENNFNLVFMLQFESLAKPTIPVCRHKIWSRVIKHAMKNRHVVYEEWAEAQQSLWWTAKPQICCEEATNAKTWIPSTNLHLLRG